MVVGGPRLSSALGCEEGTCCSVVVSYPGPDRSVRLADLRRGKAVGRRYRNRRIGEILKELDLTEGRSTGIPKILRAMKANGSPPPSFDFDEEHTYFVTRLRVHPAVQRIPLLTDADPVTPPVGRLLKLLAASGELGNAQIREELGLKDLWHLREGYVEPALAAGFIEYTIPDKPNSRLQQYRLTERGMAWLAQEPNANLETVSLSSLADGLGPVLGVGESARKRRPR